MYQSHISSFVCIVDNGLPPPFERGNHRFESDESNTQLDINECVQLIMDPLLPLKGVTTGLSRMNQIHNWTHMSASKYRECLHINENQQYFLMSHNLLGVTDNNIFPSCPAFPLLLAAIKTSSQRSISEGQRFTYKTHYL